MLIYLGILMRGYSQVNSTCIAVPADLVTIFYFNIIITLENPTEHTYFETYVNGVRASKVLRGSSPYYLYSD